MGVVERRCWKARVENELEQTFEGFPPPASLRARALSRAIGVTVTVASWLDRLGHVEAEATRRFLSPRLAELTPPDAMLDRKAAAERIARAVREKQRIVVFGDYDCDGMTSAAIFTEALRALGGDVTPVLASRFDGGYGLSFAALDRVLLHRPQLLGHLRLRLVRSRVARTAGTARRRRGGGRPSFGARPAAAGAGVLESAPSDLRISVQRSGFVRPSVVDAGRRCGPSRGARSICGRCLDLVAIGTIADVAPLDGDNRALVRAGLKVLGEARRPGRARLVRPRQARQRFPALRRRRRVSDRAAVERPRSARGAGPGRRAIAQQNAGRRARACRRSRATPARAPRDSRAHARRSLGGGRSRWLPRTPGDRHRPRRLESRHRGDRRR